MSRSSTSAARLTVRGLSLALLAVGAGAASAQAVYRCSTGTGGTRLSDKPCANNIAFYGPAPTPPSSGMVSRTMRSDSLPEVLPHQAFLSVDCAELSEAIRTARLRGVGTDHVRELQREWRDRCTEQDAQARKLYEQSKQDERSRRDGVQRAAQQAQAEQKLHQDQCSQMLGNLAARRKRADLSPGEQADLQRFEATYRDRCSR